MAAVTPTQEYLSECFSYEAETGVLRWLVRPDYHFPSAVCARNWNAQFAGREAGTHCQGYISVKVNHRPMKAHRIIWKMVHGLDPCQVDHINRDRSDNRLVNLRHCTLAENAINKSRYRNNKTGLKGVSARNGRWRATIQVDKRATHLGVFDSPDEAHQAYRLAAANLHSSFASFG